MMHDNEERKLNDLQTLSKILSGNVLPAVKTIKKRVEKTQIMPKDRAENVDSAGRAINKN